MHFAFDTMVIGADHAGLHLKEHLKKYAAQVGIKLIDVGTDSQDSVDYPHFAQQACQAILDRNIPSGILICGTGIGMSIAANRFSGIRAAVCNDGISSVKLARMHNNANILCLGARLVGTSVAEDCLYYFARTFFTDTARHLRRIEQLETMNVSILK